MAKVSKNEILQACIDGIEQSFNEYLMWTGNTEWLWNAPEYLITVNIAKELWKIDKDAKYITLEDNIKYMLSEANAKMKGQLERKARGNGRSDIVFWWGKGTPRGIIEVKNAVYKKEDIQEDLDRIFALLKKKSDIEFGVLAFYVDKHFKSGNAEKKIQDRLQEKFLDVIESEVIEKGLKFKTLSTNIAANNDNVNIDEDTDAAFGTAIMIYK